VIVTCIERAHNTTARAKLTMRFGGSAVSSTRVATASCTMGARFAALRAAMKLLLGSERTVTTECIEDDHALPRRTKWRVTR
jgi:hypothetical protein